MGNQFCGRHIPRMDVVSSWRSADAASGPNMGNEKVVLSRPAHKVGSRIASSDIKTSCEDIVPPVRRMRLVRSDGSSVDGLPLLGQQAPKQALAPQLIPKAATSTVPGRSNGGGSATKVREATIVAAITIAKKALDAAATKAKEATTAAKEAASVKVAEEIATKVVGEEAMMVKVAAQFVAVARPDSFGGPDVAQNNARGPPTRRRTRKRRVRGPPPLQDRAALAPLSHPKITNFGMLLKFTKF
jgi:hypothetical protein